MAEAVAACHRNGIIHRDIKLENFLIDRIDHSDDIIIKLTDFGIACTYDAKNPPTKRCGSLQSVAPEVLFGKTGYGYKVDCWGLGVILYELLIN